MATQKRRNVFKLLKSWEKCNYVAVYLYSIHFGGNILKYPSKIEKIHS